MCCDGNDAKTWDNLIMLLIKLIIAASENPHNGSKMVVSGQFTLIIATKGVCVFVLVSQIVQSICGLT